MQLRDFPKNIFLYCKPDRSTLGKHLAQLIFHIHNPLPRFLSE